MTTEEVLSGNRIICEFMDAKPKLVGDLYFWNHAPFFYVSERDENIAMDAIVGYVKYHKSWDWLMPVVEKIIKMYKNKIIDEVDFDEWASLTHLTRMSIGEPIEYVYDAVVNYIKYYNTLTK